MVKLKCHGLLKALKKFRFWLYGCHFQLETDARILVWLLNQPLNDLSNAMMIGWLAYIRLFDFYFKHIFRNKNSAADILSRCRQSPKDNPKDEKSVNNYLDVKPYHIYIFNPSYNCNLTAYIYLYKGEYKGDNFILRQYLETL